MNSRMNRLNKEYSEVLSRNQIDLVISPGFGVVATKLKTAADNSITAFFTSFFNHTGHPAGTLPITLVDNDKMPATYEDFLSKDLQKTCQNVKNCPMGV